MGGTDVRSRRLLIVDDESANVRLLELILRQAGYAALQATTDPRRVPALVSEFRPDLILLDLHMPAVSGFEVLEALRASAEDNAFLPVLVLTGDMTARTRQRALAGGAKDFVTKPFDRAEVLLRIKNLLETRLLHLRLRGQNDALETAVGERTRELEAARFEVLERLSLAAEFRDDNTGQHTERVGRTSALLASALGLPDGQVEVLRQAARLHDVGKIGIPDAVLLKPGRLEPAEFDAMKRHTTIGGGILSNGQSALLRVAEQVALSHHERWDGSGYPLGLGGEAIPLVGRIVAVADVFDALTHARPYKQPWPVAEAADEIDRLSGRQFDPAVVRAFQRLLRQGRIETAAEPARATAPVHQFPLPPSV
jgi:putative two-component system response regulator